jgi:sec-independent protein translocase protein TatA
MRFSPSDLVPLVHSFAIGYQELLIILVVILVLFGGSKIPQLMRGVGRGVGELQKGLEEGKRSFQRSIDDEEPPPAADRTS